jgi:hypothetical protein
MFKYYNLWYKYDILSNILILVYNYILDNSYGTYVLHLMEMMPLNNR